MPEPARPAPSGPPPNEVEDVPDALRFAVASRPGRPQRLRAGVIAALEHPGEALAILRARLAGKRLRARQRLAALIGIDHRFALPPGRRPALEPAEALAAAGLAVSPSGGSLPGGGPAPFFLLLPAGHRLVLGAADAIAGAFAGEPAARALYGDALAEAPDGGLVPLLRPAFDADYLRCVDYVGPVVALRRDSLPAPDASGRISALDALLLIADRHGAGAVRHLPRVLSLGSLRGGGEGAQARLDAVGRSLARTGEGAARARVEPDGTVRIVRPLPEPHPTVSLIVPTRDRLDLLRPCIESLRRTDWTRKEILICDNGSREPGTLAYLRALEADGAARIVACPGPFNFAAMNNRAAEAARGAVLAFVNNDVEAERPDWLGRMVTEALRPEIGAVGARLIDGHGRVQHGGIVLGTGGLVTHGHRHFPGEAPGYLSALVATRSVSAVTAACLVVEAGKFRAVGGFDADRFAVDFNDVDLCLRLARAGHRTLYVGGAVLWHRESASRRPSAEAAARHRTEVEALKRRWGPLLAQDPHHHPGFDPDLSTHARLRAGWTGLEPSHPR